MKCPDCGYENRTSASFCQGCGAVLPPSNKVTNNEPDMATRRLAPDDVPRGASDTRPLEEASIVMAPFSVCLSDGRV